MILCQRLQGPSGLQGPPGPGLTRFWGARALRDCCRNLAGLQKPPGLGASRVSRASRRFQGLESLERPLNTRFWGCQVFFCLRPSPADLLQLGARTPQGGAPWKEAENLGRVRLNQCTLYIFGPLGWLEAGLCLPMYGKSPDDLYTSILHRLLPLSYPVRV